MAKAALSSLDRLIKENRKRKKVVAKPKPKPKPKKSPTKRMLPPEEQDDYEPSTNPDPDPDEQSENFPTEPAVEVLEGQPEVEESEQPEQPEQSEREPEPTPTPEPNPFIPDPNFIRSTAEQRVSRRLIDPSTLPADENSLPGTLTILFPDNLRTAYASNKPPATPLRDYVTRRLMRCRDHSAEKSIYFGENALRRLQSICHRDFSSAEEFLGWLLTSSSLRAGNTELDIDPMLLRRAMDRKDPEQTVAQMLSEYLEAGIEIKTGMR